MRTVLKGSLSRRDAVKFGVAISGGLIVSCKHMLPSRNSNVESAAPALGSPFAGYLQITADSKIRFVTTRCESGQGISAGFAVLVAEELDVDPATIEVDYAGVNNRLPVLQEAENYPTGGSSSVRLFFQPVRLTAAAARDMLIGAAATSWGVATTDCAIVSGKVVHPPSNRSATLGSLAAAAAQQSVPQSPTPKASNFKYIGKANKRTDVPAKVTGAAIFGIDVKLPNMLNATIVHCPFVSGDVASFTDTAARASTGVKNVIKTPYGLVVVADTFWHATQGARKLQIQWTQSSTANSAAILAQSKTLVESPGLLAGTAVGDAAGNISSASKQVSAYYQTQYLPHSTLEPQNCTAWVKADGSCEIWAPTQSPTGAAMLAASILGVTPDRVKVNVTLLGGGFGRRLRQDYVGEAVYAAKAMPGQPIKLVWQRPDEFTHDLFRPAAYCKMQAGVDATGKLSAWMTRIASSSILSWTDETPSNLVRPQNQSQYDPNTTEGADSIGYTVPNFRCEWTQYEPGVPVFWWRSVGHSQNGFFVESFIDECAHAAGVDPIAFRLSHLQDPRMVAVLTALRDKSGWSTPPAAGVGRGVAVHASFGSYVGHVVEVTVQTGTIYVQKVTAVIDCGTAVDVGLVQTQMEGAFAQALGATLKQEITVANGKVVQASFNACPMLVMSEMPAMTTIVLPSSAAPGGVGEAGVPTVAAAVANAVFAGTGQRLRTLPLKVGGT